MYSPVPWPSKAPKATLLVRVARKMKSVAGRHWMWDGVLVVTQVERQLPLDVRHQSGERSAESGS